MKKSFVIIAAIVMMVGFTSRVMAQVTDTKSNSANAQILGAIALTTVNPLEFGGIVPGSGGSVVIATDGTRTLTTVTGVNVSVTPTAASYTVTGTGLVAYTITIPTAAFNITNTTGTGPFATMAVSAMDCSGTLNHTFAADGTDAFTVGGTLTVANAQAPGLYTGTFDVTVAY